MLNDEAALGPDQGELRDALVRVVEKMLRESGSEHAAEFDAGKWLDDWLQHPLPAYGGLTPAEMLQRPDGFSQVTQSLLQMQSGAYS